MDAFDKQFKSLFENHEVPIDTGELWGQVEPRLKRRRFPRGLIFFILFGGLVATTFFITRPANSGSLGENREQLSHNSVFGRKGQFINNVTDNDSTDNEEKITYTVPVGKKKKIQNEQIAENTINTEVVQNDLIEENDVKAESIVNTQSSESFDQKPRILLSTKKVATNTVIQPVISLNSLTKSAPAPLRYKFGQFKYSIDAFGGFDYSWKELKAKSFDQQWYVRERLNSEHYLESFNFGLHLNISHKSGFFAGTGIEYYQIDEVFRSIGTHDQEEFLDGIVEIVTNADGSTTEVSGRKLVINQKSWNKRKYNLYRFVNIPVHLGYGFNHGLFQYELRTGLDFNIAFLREGEIIGKEGFPVSVSDPLNSIFRQYASVNLNGGFKLLYPLSKNFSLFVEPNMHFNLFTITEDEYPLEQRYFHTGIRIGSRFVF